MMFRGDNAAPVCHLPTNGQGLFVVQEAGRLLERRRFVEKADTCTHPPRLHLLLAFAKSHPLYAGTRPLHKLDRQNEMLFKWDKHQLQIVASFQPRISARLQLLFMQSELNYEAISL
uniref:Fhl1/2/3 protein n=1 Tax=Phallusia mammillata TaxID=59560 RepID=A0A6F9DCT9_9ASCI|nr:Fhl1/2/3 protein [Phallusia mammillata]